MKNLIFSITLFFVGITISFSQSSKSFFVELGGAYTTFQDIKYSTNSFAGAGLGFNIGHERSSTKSVWGFGLSTRLAKESPNTHNKGKTFLLYPNFYAKYLKKINDKLSLGVHWDILGFYFRKIEGLDNNGNYYISSSDLFVSGTYQMGKFNFGLNLGLLSFLKESTSFAFSAAQNALENGEFDYQNEKLSSPFGFKYYTLKPIGKQLNLRTKITYRLGARFSVGYQWSVRHFAQVANHPVILGSHQVLLRYNIAHKTNSELSTQLK